MSRLVAAYILAHSLAHSLALAEAAAGGEAGLGPWPGLPRVAALLGNMAFLQGQYELGRGHTLCREVTQLLAVLPDGATPHPPAPRHAFSTPFWGGPVVWVSPWLNSQQGSFCYVTL